MHLRLDTCENRPEDPSKPTGPANLGARRCRVFTGRQETGQPQWGQNHGGHGCDQIVKDHRPSVALRLPACAEARAIPKTLVNHGAGTWSAILDRNRLLQWGS
jgi:hypothetical protein